MSTNNLDRVFDPSALSAQKQVTEWVSIKETLGTKVAGNFVGFWSVPARGKFRAQVGVALSDFDKPATVYGVNLPEYFTEGVSEWIPGDACGFEYYNDKPATEPGMSATKQLRDYNPDLFERKKRGEVIKRTTAEVAEEETQEQVQDEAPQSTSEEEEQPF